MKFIFSELAVILILIFTFKTIYTQDKEDDGVMKSLNITGVMERLKACSFYVTPYSLLSSSVKAICRRHEWLIQCAMYNCVDDVFYDELGDKWEEKKAVYRTFYSLVYHSMRLWVDILCSHWQLSRAIDCVRRNKKYLRLLRIADEEHVCRLLSLFYEMPVNKFQTFEWSIVSTYIPSIHFIIKSMYKRFRFDDCRSFRTAQYTDFFELMVSFNI